MKIEMIFELGLKKVVHNALKRIKPIMTTHTMRDGVEAECNEYYNADQMKQMFLEGWKCSHNWISVKDDLPKHDTNESGLISFPMVLVCLYDGYRDTSYYDDIGEEWGDYNGEVEYWMPLPAPPMKGGNK